MGLEICGGKRRDWEEVRILKCKDEKDSHSKLCCTGSQDEEDLKKVEYVKVARDDTHDILLSKDVNVFAKAKFLNSYVDGQ